MITKEELEKEANDYADKHAFRVPYDGSNKFYDDVDYKASKEGYLAGAKPREKRISKLKRQIEKMINEIDKTIVTSNMREREIYDIQEIFRKYNFRRDSNDKWERK